ncbi:MAG: DUF4364 family protein [Lachnospiraceae bacterium]|nr:DUF4364 family protein [Lachnospiraceae bacterium]
MTDRLSVYKMMILYMLNKVDYELSASQMSEFFMGQDYCNYFSFQESISELETTDFITPKTVRNSTYYSINESGRDTLEYFGSDLSDNIKADIDKYLKDNRIRLRSGSEILADYKKTEQEQYAVSCSLKDNGEKLLEFVIYVEDEETAIRICDGWRGKSSDVYSEIMRSLLS